MFVPFDSCDTPQTSTGAPNAAQEIKKLVVCKDTGETMLHRAARLGHLVSTSQHIGGAMKQLTQIVIPSVMKNIIQIKETTNLHVYTVWKMERC